LFARRRCSHAPTGRITFTLTPDDYVEDALVHNETGDLVPQTIRKTFELVFAYDSVEGTSDLCAKVPNKLKEELEAIFLNRILDFVPSDSKKEPYNLSRLIAPSFRLRTRPEDNLRVQLTSLTLRWKDKAEFAIVPKCPLSASELSRQGINADNFPLDKATVKKARFRFEFLSSGKGRSKTITFDIGTPDACTLKNHQPDRQELIHHYLKEWRIENDNNNETIADETLRYHSLPVAV
jgi:hypothetical protein